MKTYDESPKPHDSLSKAALWCLSHWYRRTRRLIGDDDFVEVYCQCDSSVCEQRDPKGHYARAKRGEIPRFTGVSSSYEEPVAPALRLHTDTTLAAQCASRLTTLIIERCGMELK